MMMMVLMMRMFRMTMACSTTGDILQQIRMMLGAMERLLACAHCGQVLSDWETLS